MKNRKGSGKAAGRPVVPYRTVQVRVDEDTATLLKKLAGISGRSLPVMMREWLLPLVREELGRQLGVESKNLEKASAK